MHRFEFFIDYLISSSSCIYPTSMARLVHTDTNVNLVTTTCIVHHHHRALDLLPRLRQITHSSRSWRCTLNRP